MERCITSVLEGGHHNAAVPFVKAMSTDEISERERRGWEYKMREFPPVIRHLQYSFPFPLFFFLSLFLLHMAAESSLKALSLS